jgi:hypothetical protein
MDKKQVKSIADVEVKKGVKGHEKGYAWHEEGWRYVNGYESCRS